VIDAIQLLLSPGGFTGTIITLCQEVCLLGRWISRFRRVFENRVVVSW